ncbi:hypothetical protein D7Z54_25670 [Salibacterium salarium]|uniref:YesK-like protein n=1 Tax=Salibacterium salarium TaxID=284579 RepID=A0A3R9P3W6_9BACI|nr:YesK family protein [Salibacterium salarium]RSL30495.1 hypothetical protein D7Z54_25670 [Salibacterium salarium]
MLKAVPGVLVLLLTWWFRKLNLSLFARIVPSILIVIAAIILFYIGFLNSRGFEGAAYGILAFSLIGFAIMSLVIANTPKR